MEVQAKQHEFGYVQDGKVFLKGFLSYPDRQIGVVKESEEASIKYFENRFNIAKQKVENLRNLVEDNQNKGSYLMKLIHMRKYLADFDGLGDYKALFDQLDQIEEHLKELIANNRVKNFEIKKALLDEATAFLEQEFENWIEATDQFRELKMKWIKTGVVLKEHQDEFEDQFNNIIKDFYDRRKEHFKLKAREVKNRVMLYRNIIDEAEQHKDSDEFDGTFLDFKRLQQAWKTIGKVPHKKAVTLWEKFKACNDAFFERFKNFKSYKEEYPDLDPITIRENLLKELVTSADAYVQQADSLDTADKAKELLVTWKRFTSTFRGIDKEVLSKFRFDCDIIFETNYLIRVIKRKYPLFDTKLNEEKLRIKASFMRELIKKDELEIQNNEVLLNQIPLTTNKKKNIEFNQRLNNLRIQKRKLEVKKMILNEVESRLEAMKA